MLKNTPTKHFKKMGKKPSLISICNPLKNKLRACGSYQGFLDRGLPLARKLLTMAWLTVMICSTCRNHNLVLSSFMTYHWVCN
jgi:hypothetical protein